MTWLLLATGFTGALTLMYVRWLLMQFFYRPAIVDWLFDPEECADRVQAVLRRARRQVLVNLPTPHQRSLSQALVEAKMRGVHVEVIGSPVQERDPHSELHFLHQQGVLPRIDPEANEQNQAILLIDGQLLLTGSVGTGERGLWIVQGYSQILHAFHRMILNYQQRARELVRTTVSDSADGDDTSATRNPSGMENTRAPKTDPQMEMEEEEETPTTPQGSE